MLVSFFLSLSTIALIMLMCRCISDAVFIHFCVWNCLTSLLSFLNYRCFSPFTATMMLLWLHLLSVCCCPSIMLLTHYIGIVLLLRRCCSDTFFTYGCLLLNPQVLLWCFFDAVPSGGVWFCYWSVTNTLCWCLSFYTLAQMLLLWFLFH